jgi:hypothetical protein
MTPVRDRAVDRVARIINENEGNDSRAVALLVMVALEALGYRPTEARPAPLTGPRSTGSGPSEEYLAAKARIAAMPPLPEHRGDVA